VLVETLSIKESKAEKHLLRREAVARKTSASVLEDLHPRDVLVAVFSLYPSFVWRLSCGFDGAAENIFIRRLTG
jgi:hypothetical protein